MWDLGSRGTLSKYSIPAEIVGLRIKMMIRAQCFNARRTLCQVFARRAQSSSSAGAAAPAFQEQLLMFPEYSTAQTDIAKGKFKQALPSLQRMHDVVLSSMGASSGLAGFLTRDTANLLQLLGDFAGAQKLLSTGRTNAADDSEQVRYLNHMCRNHILAGDMTAAEGAASQAVAMCESSGAHLPLPLLATTYSMRGISALHTEDWEAAEEFLQLAARWSQTPLPQLVALNNLGCVYWHAFQSDDNKSDSYFVRADARKQIISQGALWKRDADTKLGAHDEENTKEALGYWQDALDEALKSASDVDSPSAAAAMCGPTGGSLSMLGPGMDSIARVVPKPSAGGSGDVPTVTKTAKAASRARKLTDDEVLAARLEDPAYAVAYACTLCNSSIARAHLGDSAKAAELLASALHALESHKGVLSVHPILGRVLSHLAFDSMAVSKAVTAEGLFRAATERLTGPHALHDARWKQELAVVHGGYSVLLSKWDKREGDCERELKAAAEMWAKSAAWTGGRAAPPSYLFPPLRF